MQADKKSTKKYNFANIYLLLLFLNIAFNCALFFCYKSNVQWGKCHQMVNINWPNLKKVFEDFEEIG